MLSLCPTGLDSQGHSIFLSVHPLRKKKSEGHANDEENVYGRENPNGAFKIKQKVLRVMKVSGEV